jgi:putative Mg2+ transporter-C (MgtC) family protein
MLDLHSISAWSQLTVIIDGAIAAVLGSIIGWERDRAGKSAGPRTMALVGGSAATIVAIGAVLDTSGTKYGDPTRALHAVITGIGFLGAGLIFNSKRHGVQGVTTAATVFSTAAMGVAVGLGFQLVGIGFAAVIMIILRSTQVLERTLRRQEYEYEEDE